MIDSNNIKITETQILSHVVAGFVFPRILTWSFSSELFPAPNKCSSVCNLLSIPTIRLNSLKVTILSRSSLVVPCSAKLWYTSFIALAAAKTPINQGSKCRILSVFCLLQDELQCGIRDPGARLRSSLESVLLPACYTFAILSFVCRSLVIRNGFEVLRQNWRLLQLPKNL